eukprot:gene2323-4516_t
MARSLHLISFLFLLGNTLQSFLAADFFHSFGGGNPFGMPSNMGGQRGQKHEEFYKRLGVDTNASIDHIKRAYRKEAMRCHPDKGGDEEQFKKLSEAYEVLSDPEKRSMYDKFGKEGLSGQGGGGAPNFGGFGDLFRGFGGFSMPVIMQLDLTLEDFYNGKEVNIPIRGEAVVKINIEPGMMGGQQLFAKGQILDSRGAPRDLIFRLNEIKHTIFQRKNADLFLTMRISLKEALLGFEKVFKHLDGKEFWIRSRKGDVTAADDILVLKDMGMPVYGSASARGRLFIRMQVEFPKKMWLEGEQKQMLERLLRPGSTTTRCRKRRPEEPVIHPVQSDLSSFGQVGSDAGEEDDSMFSQFFFR